MSAFFSQRRSRVRGSVLLVCLALLLALAVGGMAAAQITTLELRMARAEREAASAFHVVEAALGEAEAWVEANALPTMFVDQGGLFAPPGYGESPPWRDAGAWDAQNSRAASAAAGGSMRGRYMVEWLATVADRDAQGNVLSPATVDIYRITARSEGRASATLQTTYARARNGAPSRLNGRLSWTDLGI